jgi:hypothetical protein
MERRGTTCASLEDEERSALEWREEDEEEGERRGEVGEEEKRDVFASGSRVERELGTKI